MIYHLYSGADSEVKKQVITASMILALTIGLPVMGAILTRENLTPGPTTVASDDSPGVVLGDNSSGSAATDSAQQNGNESSNAVPQNKPITPARSLPVKTESRAQHLSVATSPNPSTNSTPSPSGNTPNAPSATGGISLPDLNDGQGTGGSGGGSPTPSNNDSSNIGASAELEVGPLEVDANVSVETPSASLPELGL